MSALHAHLICIALLGVDFVARTWRMQWLLAGLRHPLPFGQVFVHTMLGEAASSLTPLRLGGEPARAWAMTREGVPVTVGAVELGFLGGAAGEMGADETSLLFVWRFYTTVLGIVLGLALAGHRYGWSVILRRRDGASKPGAGGPPP